MMSRKWVLAVGLGLFALCLTTADAAFDPNDGVAAECTNWTEACNDINKGPTSHFKSTQYMYVRNNVAPRRRIQFISYDISSLKQTGEVFADSYLTLRRYKGSLNEVLSIYGVKEGFDNVNLDTGTWSNLPGVMNTPVPPMTDQITINSLDLADLSPLLLEQTNIPLTTWSNTGTSAALDEFLNADDDGTVLLMFVTFSPQDADFEIFAKGYGSPVAEPVTGKSGIILRSYAVIPTFATRPVPAIGSNKSTVLSQLSWTNPEPNQPAGNITCDVYIGTGEPNALLPNYGYTQLANDTSDNFVSLSGYPLTENTSYNWIVDVTDSSTGITTKGYKWSFNAVANLAPTVSIANPVQYLWLNNNGNPASARVVLDATANDDEPLTYLWEQITGPAVAIDPNNVQDITLDLPATGSYTFKITVSDGQLSAFTAANIFVGATPCDAAKAKPGYVQMPADFDNNCYINIADLSTFASHWLECHSFMDAPCI